ADLSTLCEGLETKAKSFDEDAKKSDKAELKRKVQELEGRKWLSEQKTSIETEIHRLRQIKDLESARKLTNTMALSKKKAELAQALVTDAFIGRFNAELTSLGASRIRVELVQTRTDKG